MLTRDGARFQVFLELRRRYGMWSGKNEIVILDTLTVEREWGWVFCYTTRGWYEGDIQYAIAGNGPILVDRHDGHLRFCGSGHSVDHHIAEYEAELERKNGTWELVIGTSHDLTLAVVSRLRHALGLKLDEVMELRKRLPGVWRSGARTDLEPDLERSLDAGIVAEIRRAHVSH